MSNANIAGELKTLRDALRALPQVAPDPGVWSELAARLRRDAGAGAVQAALDARQADFAHGDSRREIRRPPGARGFRRWAMPSALAAGIVLAAIALPLLQRLPSPAGPRPATVAASAASSNTNAANSTTSTNPQTTSVDAGADRQLAALQQRSRDLEYWLRETRDAGGPLRGQDLVAATEIEDMIGLVDGQLNAASHDSGLPLWRRRVALLEDLTVLRYSIYRVAEIGVAQR